MRVKARHPSAGRCPSIHGPTEFRHPSPARPASPSVGPTSAEDFCRSCASSSAGRGYLSVAEPWRACWLRNDPTDVPTGPHVHRPPSPNPVRHRRWPLLPDHRRSPRRQATERTDPYVARLDEMLVEVYRSDAGGRVRWRGLLVCRDASALPRWPLTGAKCPLPDGDVVAAICDSSVLSKPHDGFHILSPEWTLTHTNQHRAARAAGLPARWRVRRFRGSSTAGLARESVADGGPCGRSQQRQTGAHLRRRRALSAEFAP